MDSSNLEVNLKVVHAIDGYPWCVVSNCVRATNFDIMLSSCTLLSLTPWYGQKERSTLRLIETSTGGGMFRLFSPLRVKLWLGSRNPGKQPIILMCRTRGMCRGKSDRVCLDTDIPGVTFARPP